jgi:hypothetical protein
MASESKSTSQSTPIQTFTVRDQLIELLRNVLRVVRDLYDVNRAATQRLARRTYIKAALRIDKLLAANRTLLRTLCAAGKFGDGTSEDRDDCSFMVSEIYAACMVPQYLARHYHTMYDTKLYDRNILGFAIVDGRFFKDEAARTRDGNVLFAAIDMLGMVLTSVMRVNFGSVWRRRQSKRSTRRSRRSRRSRRTRTSWTSGRKQRVARKRY